MSGDYWNRHLSRVMFLDVQVGNGKLENCGDGMDEYLLTPYSVEFRKDYSDKNLAISYEFCKNKPAMTVAYLVTNKLNRQETFRVFTGMDTGLRTSSTYNLKQGTGMEYDEGNAAVKVNYDSPETGNACLFVINAGEKPARYNMEKTGEKPGKLSLVFEKKLKPERR